MSNAEHPLVGHLVRWRRGTNRVRGLAVSYDPRAHALSVLVDPSIRVSVPELECTLSTSGTDPEIIDDITAYVSGLTAARDAISLVVADLAIAQDIRRCAGASRAYGTVDALIAAQVLKTND